MFVASRLLSAITQPVFWLAAWWIVALLLLRRHPRAAKGMLWTGLVVLGLLGFRAFPDALLRPLETRYPLPPPESIGDHRGVIVLGGALGEADIYRTHGQVPLGDAAERMTVPLAWMRTYAGFELVFSGGEGRLLTRGVSEAQMAGDFYAAQSIDMRRVRLESGSRNTRENAQNVAALLGERCREPWLLVTSASHLPRAVAEFEAVGCTVTPYPVDYRTGERTPWTDYSLAHSLVEWQTALHEWLGLAVYRWTR